VGVGGKECVRKMQGSEQKIEANNDLLMKASPRRMSELERDWREELLVWGLINARVRRVRKSNKIVKWKTTTHVTRRGTPWCGSMSAEECRREKKIARVICARE